MIYLGGDDDERQGRGQAQREAPVEGEQSWGYKTCNTDDNTNNNNTNSNHNTYMYVCMHACMHVCMRVYIYIYIYTYTQ